MLFLGTLSAAELVQPTIDGCCPTTFTPVVANLHNSKKKKIENSRVKILGFRLVLFLRISALLVGMYGFTWSVACLHGN